MNSIRRPRKRPRVRSVSFQTFGWVLIREAALCIGVGRGLHGAAFGGRDYLAHLPPRHVMLRAERILRFNEARRYYP